MLCVSQGAEHLHACAMSCTTMAACQPHTLTTLQRYTLLRDTAILEAAQHHLRSKSSRSGAAERSSVYPFVVKNASLPSVETLMPWKGMDSVGVRHRLLRCTPDGDLTCATDSHTRRIRLQLDGLSYLPHICPVLCICARRCKC